jgi:hypothetical protein
VVLRYLGAFGPATTSDISAWCRLRGMAEVVERLRPRLRVFRTERGRELFDLPDAPRPDPGVPAPIRFLPEYDNLWLAHDDRSRVLTEDDGRWMQLASAPFRGSVLIDGWLRASWHLESPTREGTAALIVTPIGRLSKRTVASVSAEARRLLRMIGRPDDDVRVTEPPD